MIKPASQCLRGSGRGWGKAGSEFIFNCSKFFFSFLPLGQAKGGDVHEERAFWAKLHMFLLVSDSFSVSLFRVKKFKTYILISPFLKIGEDTRLS